MKASIIYTGLIIFLLAGVVIRSNSQVLLKGTVINKSNEALNGASIRIKGNANGVISDSLGQFSLDAGKKTKVILQVSSVGYEPAQKEVNTGDSLIEVTIILKDQAKQLGEVIVNAGSFEASDKAKGASLTPIDAVTVAGNGGDIANALRWLPGTQQIGEKEGLFVRGGTNEEAKQFVDETVLPHPNFSPVPGLLQPARLNPFLFNGILFSSGGYSAAYGQAMSSALILETTDLPEQSSATLHIFPQDIGTGWQKLSTDKKSSYGARMHYSNLQFYNRIVPQKTDFTHGPEIFGADVNFRVKTGKRMLKFYTNYGYSHIGMRNPDVDSVDLYSSYEVRGKNLFSTLSYRQPLAHNWKIDAVASYNYYRENITNAVENENRAPASPIAFPYDQKNNKAATSSGLWQLRTMLSKKIRNNQALRFGSEYHFDNEDYKYNDTLSSLNDHFTSLFAEADIRVNRNIALRAGARAEYSSVLQQFNLAPRISAAYKFSDGGQINLAYGIFYQKPEVIYLLQNAQLDYSRATHYIINYQRKQNNRFFRIEAYYKEYKNLVQTLPSINNSGNGYAQGIELFWRDKKTFKNFDYWLTYTYLDTKRKFMDYPVSLRPEFATPHTLSLAVKRFFPDINFNANLSYAVASGRPYYDIRTGVDGNSAVYDKGTTNMYNSMNLSFAYLFSLFKKWKNADFSGIGFGVNNVFGTNQVFGYNYSYDGRNKMPVTLPAARSFYIGIFMSFGIDRTENYINDNL